MSEVTRSAWDRILAKLGSYELARKISKLESYRIYTRRWPYDGAERLLSLDEIVETPSSGLDPLEQIIIREETERYLAKLTPKQRNATQLTYEGYKPREIAESQGDENSGKVRYHKHAAKEKLKIMIAGEEITITGLPRDPFEQQKRLYGGSL